MTRIAMPVIIFIIAANAGMAARGEDSPGLKLEKQVLAEREKLQHGRVLISGRMSRPVSGDAKEFRYEIEFHRQNVRVEQVLGSLQNRRIATPSHVISAGSDRIDLLDNLNLAGPAKTDDVFDPRLFGISISTIVSLDNHRLHDRLAFADRRNESVADETYDDILVRRVEYDRLVGSHIALWIAPEQGFTLLRAQASGGGTTSTLDVTWKDYGDGAWYPTQVAYVQVEGERVLHDEVATVESADFDYVPDASRFMLVSLNLQPGTPVMHNGVEEIWNGRTLQPLQEVSAMSDPPQSPSTNRGGLLWLVVAVACAGVALLVTGLRGRQPVKPD